jgi:hypothetical protein
MLAGQLLAGLASADSWIGPRKVKYVEVWHTNDGVGHAQIGTAEGMRYNYHSNSTGCTPEGLKTIISMALTARASDEYVRFYVAEDGPNVNFTRMIVGELY